MPILTKGDWGGVGPLKAPTPFDTKLGVGIHWEGPKLDIERHDQCVAAVRRIQADHMAGRNSDKYPWNDGAYNLLACEHGFVFVMRGPNARSAANGTYDANAHWGAICYLGGVGDAMTEEGWAALHEGFAYMVASGFPAVIRGHRDFKATSCPGDEIYANLQRIASNVAATPAGAPVVVAFALPPVVPSFPAFGGTLLHVGSSGPAVRTFQQQLANRGWRIGVDGSFGSQTKAIVEAFQKDKRLGVDGVVGPATWNAAFTAAIT